MEKKLSLSFDETSALLEMSICSGAKSDEGASASALTKLAYLYREFVHEEQMLRKPLVLSELPRAA